MMMMMILPGYYQSGANCLWYTNYTHIVGEPTLAPEMRTFPNIEPYLEVHTSNTSNKENHSVQYFSQN